MARPCCGATARCRAYVDVNALEISVPEPVLVDGDRVILIHVWQGIRYVSVLEFTAAGDLKVVEHQITTER
jgi:hypothetical protein